MQLNEVERGRVTSDGGGGASPALPVSPRRCENVCIVVCLYTTMDNWLTQMGSGTKRLTERYAEYPAPAHDQQLYYAYEPSSPSHGHAPSSKHQYGGGGHKSNAAMSALTLLAFLFFLHILQQCLKEHMTAMSTPQVMVVSAGREGGLVVTKMSNKEKLDKAGLVRDVAPAAGVNLKNKMSQEANAPTSIDGDGLFLTRIATAEHTPRRTHSKYTHENKIVNYTNRTSVFDGFVSAMDKK